VTGCVLRCPNLEAVINAGVRTVIYDGDADFIVNYMGVEAMVRAASRAFSLLSYSPCTDLIALFAQVASLNTSSRQSSRARTLRPIPLTASPLVCIRTRAHSRTCVFSALDTKFPRTSGGECPEARRLCKCSHRSCQATSLSST
jgi:hypothetical protein